MVWIVYFINLILADENPLIGRWVNMDLSEVDYPAITICSEQTTKYAFAEQLGNYLDPNKVLPNAINKFQKNIISQIMTQYSYGYGNDYHGSCINKLTAHQTDQICKVRQICIHFQIIFAFWKRSIL